MKDALWVATAFGQDFYIVCGMYGSVSKTDAFVPAWLVQQGSKSRQSEANLKVETKIVDFNFDYKTFMVHNKITVKVTFYFMRPFLECLGQKNVQLVRESGVEGQVRQAVPKAKAGDAKKASKKVAAMMEGCKHLYK